MPVVSEFAGFFLQHEYGVLIVRITAKQLVNQGQIQEIKSKVLANIGCTEKGVVVDCSRVTGPMSSEFLNVLVRLLADCKGRQIGFAVANLGENQKEILRVTALDKVIPLVESASDGVWEFGDFEEWDRVRVECSRDYARKNRTPDTYWQHVTGWLAENRTVAGVGACLMIALVAVSWLLTSGQGRRANADQLNSGNPFKAAMQGKLTYKNRNVELSDSQAIVIAWPVGFTPAKKLDVDEVKSGAQKVGTDDALPNWPYYTQTDANGRFKLDLVGRGATMDFQVLLVSSQLGSRRPHEDEQVLLEAVLDASQRLIGRRRFAITRVNLKPNVAAPLNWEF